MPSSKKGDGYGRRVKTSSVAGAKVVKTRRVATSDRPWVRVEYKNPPERVHQEPAKPVLGPFFKKNRRAVQYQERALVRQRERGGPRLWPAFSEDEGMFREQTPFGPVTAGPAPASDWTITADAANLDYKVAMIQIRGTDYGITGDYKNYVALAGSLSQEMAGLVLMEVYETLGRFTDSANRESEAARQQRSRAARKGYEDGTFDGQERAVMAVFYALALFSEDQRNAGGKGMRAALWRVLTRKRTALESFGGATPDFPQARAQIPLPNVGPKVGGREYQRLIQHGTIPATTEHIELERFVSEDSDDEGETATHRQALAKKLKKTLQPYLAWKKTAQKGASSSSVRSGLTKLDLRRGQSFRARAAAKTKRTPTARAKQAKAAQRKLREEHNREARPLRQGRKRARSTADVPEQRPTKRARSRSSSRRGAKRA